MEGKGEVVNPKVLRPPPPSFSIQILPPKAQQDLQKLLSEDFLKHVVGVLDAAFKDIAETRAEATLFCLIYVLRSMGICVKG